METWVQRKQWADQFTPNIKTILGHLFIKEAPVKADQRENTDLMFEILGKTFAVRVRKIQERMARGRDGQLYNRRNEWTIRLTKTRGENELSRILDGFGDFCLYGWGDETTKPVPKVLGWTVFDLSKVSTWMVQYVLNKKDLPGQIQMVDQYGSFLAICIDDMPKRTIVYRNTVILGDPEFGS